MNIALISPLPPPTGGIATWTVRYKNYFDNTQHKVTVINSAVKGKRITQLHNKDYLSEITRTAGILKSLKNELNSKTDIAHLNSPCGKLGIIRDYLCAREIKKRGIKLVCHFHCDVTYMLKNSFQIKYFKKLVALSDDVLVLNKISYDYILKNCNKKSRIVANFVSDMFKEKLSETKNISEKITSVSYVGNLLKTKGIGEIINASKNFPDIKFVLTGTKSEFFNSLDIPKNVELTGEIPLEDVMQKLSASDLFVFPSYTEGFPTALLEAMSMGLPCIATDVGAIPDMIEEKGGIIVPVGDCKSLCEAIDKMQDKNLRQNCSVWNKEKVKNNYTVDKVMKTLTDIYEEIL